MKTLKLMSLMALACACVAGFAPKASAVTALVDGDSHYVGLVDAGIPASEADRVAYVNHLIGMGLGATDNFMGQDFYRSMNNFGSLPTAVLGGFASSVAGNPSTSIDLGAGGTYMYLIAKYDGPNFGSIVWYVGDLSGIITIPATAGGYGLSGWTLFMGEGSTGVPDSGSTIALLGLALAGAELFRRTLRLRTVKVAKD